MKDYQKKAIIDKIRNLFNFRPRAGGLEISDSSARFAYLDGQSWELAGRRLPAGLLENGVIKDRLAFVGVLSDLRTEISNKYNSFKRRQSIDVVVSLNSVHFYTHVFSLPMTSNHSFNRAVELNIEMVSPAEASKIYSGWQVISEDRAASKAEILSSFADRSLVDNLIAAVKEAGFLPIALEPSPLSLARFLREASSSFDAGKNYIMLRLDNSGLDILVVREGQIHFNYFNSWNDMQADGRQTTLAGLQETIVNSLHRVLNFYGSSWTDRPADIIVSATAFQKETSETIAEKFPFLNVRVLGSRKENLGAEWFPAIGAGVRGLVFRFRDRDISLLGISVQEEFRRQQLSEFFQFWSAVVSLSLWFMLAVFAAFDFYLGNLKASVGLQTFSVTEEQKKQVDDFSTGASDFNRAVSFISAAESKISPKINVIDKIKSVADGQNISISKLSFRGYGSPLSLSAIASSKDQIASFKKSLESDQYFSNVDLNIAGIESTGGGYSFTITFGIKQQS